MKKIVTFTTVFCFLMSLSFSCASIKETESMPDFSLKMQNHSFLDESNIGEEITVSGILKSNEGNIWLIENPESRSQVTFELITDSKMDKKLSSKKYYSKMITVTGTLTSVSSPWKKTIKVKTFTVN